MYNTLLNSGYKLLKKNIMYITHTDVLEFVAAKFDIS